MLRVSLCVCVCKNLGCGWQCGHIQISEPAAPGAAWCFGATLTCLAKMVNGTTADTSCEFKQLTWLFLSRVREVQAGHQLVGGGWNFNECQEISGTGWGFETSIPLSVLGFALEWPGRVCLQAGNRDQTPAVHLGGATFRVCCSRGPQGENSHSVRVAWVLLTFRSVPGAAAYLNPWDATSLSFDPRDSQRSWTAAGTEMSFSA